MDIVIFDIRQSWMFLNNTLQLKIETVIEKIVYGRVLLLFYL